MSLPYIQEGNDGGRGLCGVSREGRDRFEHFPDIIADDGFFRLQFTPNERIEVRTAQSVVSAPANSAALIRIKTRSRLGYYQLRSRFPTLFMREARTKQYGKAFLAILRKPGLWLCAGPYLWINLVSRYRARRQARALSQYVWERDNSSRTKAHCSGKIPVET